MTASLPLPVSLPRRQGPRLNAGWIGAALLLLVAVPCLVTLPWSATRYDVQRMGTAAEAARRGPSWAEPLGTDQLGRSMLWRCLLGGAISLGIGTAAAAIAVLLGVGWGAVAGLAGGRADALLMRTVDVLYGLPYILLVVLLDLALEPTFERAARVALATDVAAGVASVATLLVAIGAVSWLTMARVIRGQVLSLRAQAFVEAARACGAGPGRILLRHMLPNLVGPIVVYTTLTVPSAILQESFLSFLGIGVQPPLPSWGRLVAEGLDQVMVLSVGGRPWWVLAWPCALLAATLLGLNLVGDDLRARLDPRSRK